MTVASHKSQTQPRFRVIKVGGSLFTMPELQKRIVQWSTTIADSNFVNVWVAGGGAMVDAVRNWHSLHGIDDSEAHRICINLLSDTAQLFHSLFPNWHLIDDINQLVSTNFKTGCDIVFDCSTWAQENSSLEASWETTSDTIALQLAATIEAEGLYLLKSTRPVSSKISDAIDQGLIDRNFAKHCSCCPEIFIKITDLRESATTVKMVW